jgi:two-component system, chemotaxis family, chemotaxis protein CheY
MKKILVIDDDPVIRHTLTKVLCRNGYDVVTAEDGNHGLRIFRTENPGIVVTDIIMPEQEGIETIIKLRREKPDVKIIAMSGGGRISKDDLLHTALRLGADHIITKPFSQQELLTRLHQLAGSVAQTAEMPRHSSSPSDIEKGVG